LVIFETKVRLTPTIALTIKVNNMVPQSSPCLKKDTAWLLAANLLADSVIYFLK